MDKAHEFDHYAGNYELLHNENIAITGESSEYFVRYKHDHFLRLHPGLTAQNGKCIVDYGCGIGRLAVLLAESCSNSTVIGVDPSSECIKAAQIKCRPNLRFVHDPQTGLPLDEGSADFVILANVLHHVQLDDRHAFVGKLERLLRPGGQLVIYEHNPYNPLTCMAVERCVFDKNAVLTSLRATKRLLLAADMSISRSGYIVFFPKVLKVLRRFEPGLVFFPLGAQYFIIGEKES